MLTTVIIDDEIRSINVLAGMLQKYCPGIHVAATTHESEKAVDLIKEIQPQLLFLDIRMPGLNGFDILDHFTDLAFKVIFTTAYDNHAIQAIKYKAFDYLLKPISIKELKDSISRLEDMQQLDTESVIAKNMNLSAKQGKMPIPSRNGYEFISTKDIVWIQASESYTIFHLQNKPRIIASNNLKKYETLLDNTIFYRIHHSHIINIEHLKKYVRNKIPYVVMSDGKELEVSQRRKTVLSKILHII